MRVILTVIILLTSNYALAEIYKWVDEDGNVHFGDSMPVSANPEEVHLKVNSYTSTSFDTADTNTDMVELYSTSWCGYCKKAKQYFTENKIKYTEYDIEESLSAKMNYDKLGVSGVPVILYKGKQMSGFSVSGFRRLYNK